MCNVAAAEAKETNVRFLLAAIVCVLVVSLQNLILNSSRTATCTKQLVLAAVCDDNNKIKVGDFVDLLSDFFVLFFGVFFVPGNGTAAIVMSPGEATNL